MKRLIKKISIDLVVKLDDNRPEEFQYLDNPIHIDVFFRELYEFLNQEYFDMDTLHEFENDIVNIVDSDTAYNNSYHKNMVVDLIKSIILDKAQVEQYFNALQKWISRNRNNLSTVNTNVQDDNFVLLSSSGMKLMGSSSKRIPKQEFFRIFKEYLITLGKKQQYADILTLGSRIIWNVIDNGQDSYCIKLFNEFVEYCNSNQ